MTKIPAIMWSFGLSTVYAIQGILQGYVLYGCNNFGEIIPNFGREISGTSIDSDTAKFNE